MVNIFNIPLILLNQIKRNPYFGTCFLALILLDIVILSVVNAMLEPYHLSLIYENFRLVSFIAWGLFVFVTAYSKACFIDHLIILHNNNKLFYSSCTAFITTLVYVYSIDPKMKLSFKKDMLVFEIKDDLLSASDKHKYKEYQILSKYLSSQLFYKGFPNFEHQLILQWREQCKRFEGRNGDLSAHWINSTDELKKIIIPHRKVILEIAKNIEIYKEDKKNSPAIILDKIRESFEHNFKK